MSIEDNTKLREAISKAVLAYQESTAVLIQKIEVQWNQDHVSGGPRHSVYSVVIGIDAEGVLAD